MENVRWCNIDIWTYTGCHDYLNVENSYKWNGQKTLDLVLTEKVLVTTLIMISSKLQWNNHRIIASLWELQKHHRMQFFFRFNQIYFLGCLLLGDKLNIYWRINHRAVAFIDNNSAKKATKIGQTIPWWKGYGYFAFLYLSDKKLTGKFLSDNRTSKYLITNHRMNS